METNSEYKFEASLSQESFPDKVIAKAMTGAGTKENQEIRRRYHFNPTKGISFRRGTFTPQELLDSLLDGHCVCWLFKTSEPYWDSNNNYEIKERKDGSFPIAMKRNELFEGSYCVGIDIDECEVSPTEYIDQLSLKPTFWYTTFSYGKTENDNNFRLIYVFKKKIEGVNDEFMELYKNDKDALAALADIPMFMFRYVSKLVHDLAEADTGLMFKDSCGMNPCQHFIGTNRNTEGINVESGITNIIYSFDDFGYTYDGFMDFLASDAYYKSEESKEKYKDSLRKILKLLRPDLLAKKDKENKDEEFGLHIETDEEFINNLRRLSFSLCNKKYGKKYQCFYRSDNGNWIDKGNYKIQYIDKNYLQLDMQRNKRQDGHGRRALLLSRICLRRLMRPDADFNTLLWNAYQDMHRYVVSDGSITIDTLVKSVKKAMRMSLDEIKETYSESIVEAKKRAPKCGYITKGLHHAKVSKDINEEKIEEYINLSISVKENLEILKEHGIEVSDSKLYEYFKENGVELKCNKSISDEELKNMIDLDMSANMNYKKIHENYNVSRVRVLSIYKDLKIQSVSSEESELHRENIKSMYKNDVIVSFILGESLSHEGTESISNNNPSTNTQNTPKLYTPFKPQPSPKGESSWKAIPPSKENKFLESALSENYKMESEEVYANGNFDEFF